MARFIGLAALAALAAPVAYRFLLALDALVDGGAWHGEDDAPQGRR